MRHKNILLNAIGVFFILLGIAAFSNSLSVGHPGQVFWFCYIALFFIGIGIFLRNSAFILTQFNIMAIPLLIWTSDFLFVLITRGELFGITNYFFIPGPILGKAITAQHLFALPLILVSLYIIKVKKMDVWKFSFAEMAFIFLFTRIFTSEQYNINCVFRNCMKFSTGPSWLYPILWFLGVLFLVFATNYIAIRIKFLKEKG